MEEAALSRRQADQARSSPRKLSVIPLLVLMPKLEKVLRIFHSPQRYVGQMRKLIDEGDLEFARELAVEAKARYGKYSEVNLLHAKVHFALNEWDEAKDSLRYVANGENDLFEYLLEAAELYMTMDDDDHAIKILEQVGDRFRGWQSGVAYNRIGHIYQRHEKPRASLMAFSEAVAVGGRVSWANFIQILAECNRDDLLACKKKMEEQLKAYDRNAFFYKALSLVESYLGNREEMIERIRAGAKKRFVHSYQDIPWVDTSEPLKPEFLIMGAMKCGTTSLFEQLENHPLILTTMDKELQFFQHDELDESWYFNHFPRVSEFPGFIAGDGSPGYYAYDVVDRVKELCPDIRLLFIQRDPVARAISHLRHNNRQGAANCNVNTVLRGVEELEREILDSPENAEQVILDMCFGNRDDNSYLSMGCYEILLRRWRRAFPPEQLMVIELEDYIDNPQGTMNNIFEFLGLDPIEIEVRKSNTGNYIKHDAETLAVVERLEQFYRAVDSIALPAVS